MASARKQLGSETAHGEKDFFDEALQRVQKWNEALKCERLTVGHGRNIDMLSAPPQSKVPGQEAMFMRADNRKVSPSLSVSLSASSSGLGASLRPSGGASAPRLAEKLANPISLPQREDDSDNWDDDFEGAIAISKLQRRPYCPLLRGH